MKITLETTPTQFIEAAGTRFAYRRLGPRDGTPLVCLQHFSGTMGSWDPAVLSGSWWSASPLRTSSGVIRLRRDCLDHVI